MDQTRGSYVTVRLWDAVWTVSIRFVYHCLRNHKNREGLASHVRWEVKHNAISVVEAKDGAVASGV